MTMLKPLSLAFAMLVAVAAPLRAETPPQFDKAQRADGARLAPDKFLRGYDPLTVFFESDAGPKAGGPEDAPAKFVTMSPPVTGEWRWLGPRALQFRPADAWTPLQRIGVKIGAAETRLVALLPAPSSTAPADGADPVDELTQITLTFAAPVDVAALSRLVSVELRPAPGIAAKGGQMLDPAGWDIRPLERKERGAEQSYALRFKESIADGRVAIVRLKLSDAPGLDDQIFELRVRTAPPFSVTEATCGRGWNDEKLDAVLRCASNGPVAPAPESGEEEGGEPEATYAPSSKRRLTLTLSSTPQAIDILAAREALRISPPVDDLAVETDNAHLKITGKFLSDRVYDLSVAAGALRDARGRSLGAAFRQRFAFANDAPTLQWQTGHGLVERLGPQLLPAQGREYDRADIRIHAIDPLARDFWPFPKAGVTSEDAAAPPLAGAEPPRWKEAGNIEADAIKERIKALGSPAVSRMIDLPIRRNGADARFGLDLAKDFAAIAGAEQPGAYLVGLRAVDSDKRQWLRVQVTDLVLSAIEEPGHVRFAVTSLSTTQPVAGAEVRIEGVKDDKYITIARGVTDASGFFTFTPTKKTEGELRRVVVSKALDILVIDPDDAPTEYRKEVWSKPEGDWLAWTVTPDEQRAEKPRILCHVFSERPIYRPEEPVHIKGYVRSWRGGALSLTKKGGALVINGPSKEEWRIPVKPDALGGFYYKFDAQTPAAGVYSAHFEPTLPKPKAKDKEPEQAEEPQSEEAAAPADAAAPEEPTSCGAFSFKKEAYRLPTFEVVLNAPQTTALDGKFDVELLARYFAGGLAAERPVRWRVAQFPHVFTPPGREGFLFSSDARFSGEGAFKSSAVSSHDGHTDAGGASRMSFDTTIEPTAQPRRYSIEATVTGDDGLEVRNVANVIALPPFVLGVKTPRYVERPGTVTPELIALDGKGAAVEGLDMTLRFIRRNWISTLQASDFAQGSAKYVTQARDETVLEKKVTSTKEAQKITLDAREAGVYVVQLEARDRIGRRQQVSVDFFVGGETPVTFKRPPSSSAIVTTEKDKYAPGETATLVIQSPFQSARALAIVEQPNGVYDYSFVDIANGYGKFALPLKKEQTPKLAVHFLVMRGRLKDSAPSGAATFDQGKPVTIAATKWIEVTPVKNTATVKLDHPQKARPGQEVEVALHVEDDLGKPLSGEATFWMVDQAVLSLAKEQTLDPLPDFIVARESKMAARDTRNLAFGVIPLEEIAGGDMAALQEWGAENNISVRKNFTPVPVYLPNVKIVDGVARVKVKLPDTLSVFKLRAKVTSGPDRFGVGVGEMLIRQEIVAQPALPRFLRHGDAADLGLVARLVEGPAGAATAAVTATGLTLAGDASRAIDWTKSKSARIDVRVSAPLESKATSAKLGFKVERSADHARDAVEIDLPLKTDREPVRKFELVEIAPGETKTLAPIGAGVRAGTFSRSATVSGDPAVVKLVAGLDALAEYPYGCTEQRLSTARASLALKDFSPLLAAADLDGRIASIVQAMGQQIEQSVDGDGLVAFWPHARGNVSLTAWAYSFLAQAKRAGEPIDDRLMERLAGILKLSLRSDYAHLLTGEELRERVEALAALGEGGKLDDAYLAEFARHADYVPNVSVAQLASSAARAGADGRLTASLLETMWGRVKFLDRGGVRSYAGQSSDNGNPLILPSESRSLAEMTRAATLASPSDARGVALRAALLRLGDGDGWGSTAADGAAILALAEGWRRPTSPLSLAFGDAPATIDANTPVVRHVQSEDAPLAIVNKSNATLIALIETRYEPAEPGSKAAPTSEGFALTRQSWRIVATGAPQKLEPADGVLRLAAGEVIEEVVELSNPQDRTHVAITLPLPAGYEPLNPALATAPAEAQPSFAPTLAPSWSQLGDDRVFYAYDQLPKGNYRFAFRVKALTAGVFTQPPGVVETMYKRGVRATTAGVRVEIGK